VGERQRRAESCVEAADVKECGEVFQGHKHKAATSASRSKQSLAGQGRTFGERKGATR
jgi:hypothetical protein